MSELNESQINYAIELDSLSWEQLQKLKEEVDAACPACGCRQFVWPVGASILADPFEAPHYSSPTVAEDFNPDCHKGARCFRCNRPWQSSRNKK